MYKIAVIVLLFFVSCTKSIERNINCEILNIKINPSVISELNNLAQYEIDSIIELRLPDNKFITQMDKIIMYDSNIYILDKEYGKTVYVMDNLGNYLYSLGDVGRSKSEFYRQPTDFSIDKKNGNVYIFEKESRKVVVFDRNGKCENVIEFKHYWPYAFALLENDNFALAFRMKNNFLSDDYEIVVSNTSEEQISNYRKLSNSYQLTSEVPFSISEDEVFFIPTLCDTIYSIKNDTINRAISVDFGKDKMSEENRERIKSGGDHLLLKDLECVRSIDKYFENDHWVNIEYDYSSLKLNYLKNKTSNKEYNFVSLFNGLMSSNLVYIEDESLIFAMTEEDINRWLTIKDQNINVWNELYNNSHSKIKDILDHNNKNCSLIYVTLK